MKEQQDCSNMQKTFRNKKVLITGHSGFKGSWLSLWLKSYGADVVGISIDTVSAPSHFDVCNLGDQITDVRGDVRDLSVLQMVICQHQPDFIFHLAAQPIVSESFKSPIDTLNTNIMGTANLLTSLNMLEKRVVVVLITSDKCYHNNEWAWGYREIDRLGGKDPYSASKAAAELIISSFTHSFFRDGKKVRIASARAGNVIGGGDWASDRLIPDCVRSWSVGESAVLRNPESTRPWQHVLDPLYGYMVLAQKLSEDEPVHGEAFNFGPLSDQNQRVISLVREMSKHWEKVKWNIKTEENSKFAEAGLLKLNCDKAYALLGWRPTLKFEDTVAFTVDWYKTFYSNPTGSMNKSMEQIEMFEQKRSEV
jgi:CDP-glucose 4,6-dehydratase